MTKFMVPVVFECIVYGAVSHRGSVKCANIYSPPLGYNISSAKEETVVVAVVFVELYLGTYYLPTLLHIYIYSISAQRKLLWKNYRNLNKGAFTSQAIKRRSRRNE